MQKCDSIIVMVDFSKFLTGQRGSRLLLDTDGFTYNLRKDRTTSDGCTNWRCSKHRSLKCPCTVKFNPTDELLSAGPKVHNHAADVLVEEKKELINSLKQKAADQKLSATQNLVTETLASATPDLNIVLLLSKIESLARVAQRASAEASGSANHSEASTAD